MPRRSETIGFNSYPSQVPSPLPTHRFFAIVVKRIQDHPIFVFALQAHLRMEIGYVLDLKRRR